MKHLKTYENKTDYLIGAYVRLKESENPDEQWVVFKVVKIIQKSVSRKTSYYVEGFYLNTNERIEFWIGEDYIDRKPTLKEIKEFELKKDADKYNL